MKLKYNTVNSEATELEALIMGLPFGICIFDFFRAEKSKTLVLRSYNQMAERLFLDGRLTVGTEITDISPLRRLKYPLIRVLVDQKTSAIEFIEPNIVGAVGIPISSRSLGLLFMPENERVANLSSLGLMAGEIAHEINSPLTVIVGKANFLRSAIQDLEGEKSAAIEAVNKIEQVCFRISKIAKGIKAMTYVSARDAFLDTSSRELFNDIIDLSQTKLLASRLNVCLDIDEFEFECRPVEICHALINLIGNSIDAVRTLFERRLWITAKCDSGVVTIRVTDSGTGIDSNLADQIMTPFFTTKGRQSGTGLGLSIARKLIEAHGGRISLDTGSLNTSFVVTLPKKQSISKK
ncbi:MAG: hypothetical protein A4S09_03610 [Proteobacteria bacterium SG_bin7]|nr:MAG: hypothetical protein A4S09_03610 [Proteobacteria bacterium SG_bin7]